MIVLKPAGQTRSVGRGTSFEGISSRLTSRLGRRKTWWFGDRGVGNGRVSYKHFSAIRLEIDDANMGYSEAANN